MRTAIASELHDGVARSLSVIIVHAEAGLSRAEHSAAVRRELETISDTGRDALKQIRRIAHALHAHPGLPIECTSAPTLADLHPLTSMAKATMTISGTPHGLTPRIERTIYQIVQEALTNCLKHAGFQAHTHVRLTWGRTGVTVTIVNRLPDCPPDNDGQGTGLVTMARRVRALGGTLAAGPSEKGTFSVCAHIPLICGPTG